MVPDRANRWYQAQGWLVGANYIPASAINQFEMFQADTFDPRRIDTELGWAQFYGHNTARVFLHDQLWAADQRGFQTRLGQFVDIAARHHIKPLFVFFDSCWDPQPARVDSARRAPVCTTRAGRRARVPSASATPLRPGDARLRHRGDDPIP